MIIELKTLWAMVIVVVFTIYSPTLAQESLQPKLIVQSGHSIAVSSVSFSPNGSMLASGSWDHTIKLWDVGSGREIRSFKGHSDAVTSISFSPDGEVLMSSSLDKSVKLWNVKTGRTLETFRARLGPSEDFAIVTFSPDGRILAASGNQLTTVFWDLETKSELPITEGFPLQLEQAKSISITGDGKVLISRNGVLIRLWDAIGKQEVQRVTGSWSMRATSLSPNGKVFASADSDKTVTLRDLETGKIIRTLEGHSAKISSISFSSDGKILASADWGNAIKLWDVSSGKELPLLSGNGTGSEAAVLFGGLVLFSPDQRTLAQVHGRTVTLWDLKTGSELRTLQGHSNTVYSVAFSPDGKTLAAGDQGTVKLWDMNGGKGIRTLTGRISGSSISFSRDGSLLAAGGDAGQIIVWDPENEKEIRTLTGSADGVRALAFSPDGILASSRVDFKYAIEIWDPRTGMESRTLTGHSLNVNSVAFSPDGRILASGSDDETIKLWQVYTGEIRTLIGHVAPHTKAFDSHSVNAVVFSPDGTILASGSDDNTIKLWDVKTGSELRTLIGHADHVFSIAFSPDGQTLASGGLFDNTIKLWDVKTGRNVLTLSGDFSLIYSVAFSSDGKVLASGGADAKVTLWDTKTGKELCRLIGESENNWVVVTPEGRFDTNKLDTPEGLHWILSDAPFTALSFEVFMRDYYEPKLLPRLLKCTEEANCDREFKRVRDLSSLNRTQPRIDIAMVAPTAWQNTVQVSVAANNAISEYQIDSKGGRLFSSVYDLRLFRNGQLVGYSTSDERLQSTFRPYKNFDDELSAWRDANKVDLVSGKRTFTFTVNLPSNSKAKDVEFTAYAFNEDRVKSDTARASYDIPSRVTSNGKSRAYVISVGVNANENPAFDLQFAANDARRFQEVLPQRLAATGDYSEVVPISLISDWELQRGQKVVTKRDATKTNFKAVLDLLAGRPVADEIKRAIPNAEKLAKSTPDDMVLILFSSHGYADQSGNFYFIPYDTGPGACSVFTETVRQRSISSDELSLWLRDVDAGQMTLIVDACYSTAAIEGSGFKPGPMGSRGLGQLAYDKRMRILTATQADNVAMELPAAADGRPINHGLLSYALLEDGLGANKADFKPQDKTIFLDEWLEYAVADVPKLFANQPQPLNETQATSRQRKDRPRLVLLKRQLADPGACGPAPSTGTARTQEQQPSLFDFTRRKREVALVRSP